jgi:hypothetical protein
VVTGVLALGLMGTTIAYGVTGTTFSIVGHWLHSTNVDFDLATVAGSGALAAGYAASRPRGGIDETWGRLVLENRQHQKIECCSFPQLVALQAVLTLAFLLACTFDVFGDLAGNSLAGDYASFFLTYFPAAISALLLGPEAVAVRRHRAATPPEVAVGGAQAPLLTNSNDDVLIGTGAELSQRLRSYDMGSLPPVGRGASARPIPIDGTESGGGGGGGGGYRSDEDPEASATDTGTPRSVHLTSVTTDSPGRWMPKRSEDFDATSHDG